MRDENIEILKQGGVGIIPTDTVYGLVALASSVEATRRISELKGREGKGFVVIISSVEDLKIFGIEISANIKKFLDKFWPGKVSVEFFYDNSKFTHLRRPEGCNAFRLPDKPDLIDLLKQTGPLATTSANLSGQPPAKNIEEAGKYFGDRVDFYEDGGNLDSAPSTLVRIIGDQVEVLRQGTVKVD